MKEKEYVIETKHLTKSYGKGSNRKTVVNRVNLAVPKGCIYGFLGPNGAGKSTTLKMLLGLVHPDEGEITVLGNPLTFAKGNHSSEKHRLAILKETGSLIESPPYYAHLTGRENLQILCTLKQVSEKQIDEVLSVVRMETQQHKKAGHYSLGMKQRLGLAGALLGNPKLLLLDEPTNGLDPAGIQEIRELIRSLPKTRQMTVIVSSHLLGEIDQMADYAGIIQNGTLLYQDSLQGLHRHSQPQLRLRTTDNEAALRLLSRNGVSCCLQKDSLQFPEPGDERTAFLISSLVRDGIGILRVTEYQKSLEEIFLSLTGKQVSL